MSRLIASKAMNANDFSKSPSRYEDFVNENMLKHTKRNEINSECSDKKNIKADFDGDKNFRSEIDKLNESGSESESEIDLTTTTSSSIECSNGLVFVNGCIDFSNNNNNNNSDK